MSYQSTTTLDLLSGALRNIGAFEAGETLNPTDAADAQQVLNDMLQSWSQDHLIVYGSIENIFTFTPGKNMYTIGNADAGTFTGNLTGASATMTGVTIPTGLAVGATVYDSKNGGANAIPANATVTAIGVNTVTMSANALFTPAATDIVTYTAPGDFVTPRPLSITQAYTRITNSGNTGIDYPIEITTVDKYTRIGLKSVSGPWPTLLYYNNTYPLGTLYFYPNPSQAGSLHLWTDTILQDFINLNDPINLPQGYARAIKKNLALELAPEYGKTPSPLLQKQAQESRDMIKSLNAEPAVQAFFDQSLLGNCRNDAGWIMNGGFNR